LIPRYFDLLLLLVERRDEAIPRREILDLVWSDVVVSDGALSQAVRTLRRTLGDDFRQPSFIRTVSRHGYRFVFPDVVEGPEDAAATPPTARAARRPREDPRATSPEPSDRIEEALETLLNDTRVGDKVNDDPQCEAAETLHALGMAAVLERLGRRAGHTRARALLRDARWDVPGAGPVPILGQPGPLGTTVALIGLRVRRVLRLAGRRWLAGTLGGATTGLIAGFLGGLVLRFGPGSGGTGSLLVALPVIGLVIGGLGAAGVGAGLALAEVAIRSYRGLALMLFGAVGGGGVGIVTHALGLLVLEGLFGKDPSPVAGGLEGCVLGGAVGLGYALTTPTADGGMASPRGASRLWAALGAGACCALAAVLLSLSGRRLGAMSLDLMSRSFPGSQMSLAPLARLLGEAQPGRFTATVIGAWEGLMFGLGLVLGITHRPR
jgi:DNA-binding winged helix-turn-helix (wHTH) protein